MLDRPRLRRARYVAFCLLYLRASLHSPPPPGPLNPLRAWLDAFLFTQAIEIPIYVFAQRRQRVGNRAPEWILAAFAASAVTHPVVWFVIPRFPWFGDVVYGYWLQIAVSETFAVVAEALLFHLLCLRKAFLWSLAANAASAGLGLLLRELIGWP